MQKKKMEEITEISQKEGINIDLRRLEALLYFITQNQDFWSIAAESRIFVFDLLKVIEKLKEMGEIEIGKRIVPKGEIFEEIKGIEFVDWKCKACKGRGVLFDRELLKEYKKIAEGRPEPISEYDQGYQTPESVIARVAFMEQYGDVKNRRILILGDDDLMSLALALTGKPKEIVVYEIDERICDFIEKRSKEIGFDIDVRVQDLQYPIAADHIGHFDTFHCDPLESVSGLKMFLVRGIAGLKKGGSGYFGITVIESYWERWVEFQKMVLELGAVITDILPDFSYYVPWGYITEQEFWKKMEGIGLEVEPPKKPWYRSHLWRVVAVNPTRENEFIKIEYAEHL